MKIRKKVLIAAFSLVKRILTANKSNTSEKDNLLLKKKKRKKAGGVPSEVSATSE